MLSGRDKCGNALNALYAGNIDHTRFTPRDQLAAGILFFAAFLDDDESQLQGCVSLLCGQTLCRAALRHAAHCKSCARVRLGEALHALHTWCACPHDVHASEHAVTDAGAHMWKHFPAFLCALP
ncbi:hypothetical protein EON67_07860 [archaeon]|nr:MAG: hypothetical protein EON67_07860 [archaeon]